MAGEITPEAFRAALGCFATGVAVVTTRLGDVYHGMTANAFTSVSLDPLLVLVCVERSAWMHELLEQSRVFAASVLAENQEDLSVWFASPDRPRDGLEFEQVPWEPSPKTGCPRLGGALAYVDAAVRDVHDGGDHSIFVAEVTDVAVLPADGPLLYYRGGYGRFAAAAAQKVPNSRSPKSPRPGTM